MPPAIIGGVIAAAGTIGATALGSKANSKAIKRSTAAQQDSTAQQMALQREVRAQNTAALSPFMERGNAAGNLINAALGIGTTLPAGQAPTGGVTAQSPQQSALTAYEAFKQSTGYQTRLDEGMRSLNAGYAGAGVLQSGAAQRAAIRFGQDYGSREFGNWLGYLGNQQGLGFSGASALAGVSQGAADRMGAISQNAADFAGQAAVARAQNQGALYTGIAGALGQAAGALSSYSRPPVSYGGALPGGTPPYVINNYGYG